MDRPRRNQLNKDGTPIIPERFWGKTLITLEYPAGIYCSSKGQLKPQHPKSGKIKVENCDDDRIDDNSDDEDYTESDSSEEEEEEESDYEEEKPVKRKRVVKAKPNSTEEDTIYIAESVTKTSDHSQTNNDHSQTNNNNDYTQTDNNDDYTVETKDNAQTNNNNDHTVETKDNVQTNNDNDHTVETKDNAQHDYEPRENGTKITCQEPHFSDILHGTKKIEGRCGKKYAQTKEGDTIQIVSDDPLCAPLVKTLKRVTRYKTFEDLLRNEVLSEVLPRATSLEEGLLIYLQFYSLAKQEAEGVWAWEFC